MSIASVPMLGPTRITQARVDAVAKLLLLDDPLPECDEALSIGRAHTSRQLFFVFGGNLAAKGEQLAALAGQIQGADPAVRWIGATFDQAAPLERSASSAARRRTAP